MEDITPFHQLYTLIAQFTQYAIVSRQWVQCNYCGPWPNPRDHIELDQEIFEVIWPTNQVDVNALVLAEFPIEVQYFVKDKTWSNFTPDEKILWANTMVAAFRRRFHEYLQEKYNVTEILGEK